jgi:hypothetical protein
LPGLWSAITQAQPGINVNEQYKQKSIGLLVVRFLCFNNLLSGSLDEEQQDGAQTWDDEFQNKKLPGGLK